MTNQTDCSMTDLVQAMAQDSKGEVITHEITETACSQILELKVSDTVYQPKAVDDQPETL
jgi:hypothetical protein